MTETKDNSSLPLLLSITGAVLAVAVGGWFLLNRETSVTTVGEEAPAIAAMTGVATIAPTSARDPLSENEGTSVENQSGPDMTPTPEKESADIETEIRKARLAAEADILVFPTTQSALYYYGRVLNSDPQHAIATAELDAILARVEQDVRRHLEAEEFSDAYEIAMLVAKHRPAHALVVETERTVDQYTAGLVAEAIKHAQDGDDDQATQVLADAESLPGQNPLYFSAVRDSIAEIQEVRLAAERDRAERRKLADGEAMAAWGDRIQEAIAQGNLISPAGASAIDLLAERNSWAAERSRLSSEVLSALVNTAQSHIDEQSPVEAEELVRAAVLLGGNASLIDEIRSSLELALVQAESNRVAKMTDLVTINTAPARYPRRALQRSTTGWVDVYFTVTPTGETADIEIDRSEPGSVFDKAAVDAVTDWAFQPVEFRGQVISKRVVTRLVFRLE